MGKVFNIMALIFGVVMTIYWFYLKSYMIGSIFIVLDIILLGLLLIPMKGGDTEQYVEA